MQPIELDVACGIHGSRAAWHREVLAHVDPQHFVASLQQWVDSYLREAEGQIDAVRTAASAVDTASPNAMSGSAVSEGSGVVAASSRVTAPEPEKPRGRASKPKEVPELPDEPRDRQGRLEARRHARIDEHLKQRGVA